MAGQLLEKTRLAGVPNENVFIDPLVYPVFTNPESALTTIMAIEQIMAQIKGVHTTCGLTNASYGMPQRRLINRTFLACAMANGLDSAIIDPTDDQLYDVMTAANLVMGLDNFSVNYITACRAGRLG